MGNPRDTDVNRQSPHHTLGDGPNQAASGDHGSSHLQGVTISGSRTSGAAVASIIAALKKLGATDATTP